ncbi:MAG: serine/threonine-protein phosphatase [Alphaproteobacteria bacterium]|jgi:PPM family protein phosphatase|nr:serine/threonine-protein phosphatase [Alphaproteobacteria bacterium]
MRLVFQHAELSSAGPRELNEDSVEVREFDPGGLGVAVADGLGGYFGGEIASRKATDMVFRDLQKAKTESSEAMLNIHRALRSEQDTDKNLTGMATTLTYGIFSNESVVGGHCGDTRIVLIRGKGIKKITEDHTEVQRLLGLEKLSKEEAINYSRRHILERALGAKEPPVIDPVNFKIEPGDRVVFSSDGVHEKIFLRELWEISKVSDTPSRFVLNVETELNKRRPEDNFSLVCIDVN